VDRAPSTPTPIYLMIRKTIKNQIHKPGMREDQMTKKNLLKKKIKRREKTSSPIRLFQSEIHQAATETLNSILLRRFHTLHLMMP